MKMQVIGFESNEGVSKRTGKPFAIGRLHTMIPIAGSDSAKGAVGHSYDAEPSILDKIKHLAPPFMADVEVIQVMKFGQPQNQVVSVVPVDRAKTPA